MTTTALAALDALEAALRPYDEVPPGSTPRLKLPGGVVLYDVMFNTDALMWSHGGFTGTVTDDGSVTVLHDAAPDLHATLAEMVRDAVQAPGSTDLIAGHRQALARHANRARAFDAHRHLTDTLTELREAIQRRHACHLRAVADDLTHPDATTVAHRMLDRGYTGTAADLRTTVYTAVSGATDPPAAAPTAAEGTHP